MLRALEIRDMLIIDRLDIAFQPGLNVLTGETGAGKSILLDSLGFVLGWRGRAELVRQGAEQGEVTAVFDLSPEHPARRILDEAGLPSGDELILRRVNTTDGRKTAWVNDRRASGDVLRALSETLVELHGQHDDRGLLNAKGHRAILDAYGGHDAALRLVRQHWDAAETARKQLAAAQEALAAVRAEEEYLRHAAKELADLEPEAGEEADLDARRRLMQAAERIREDIARAYQALAGDGAEGMVADAGRWLGAVSERAEGVLDAPIAALDRAANELADAISGIEAGLDHLKYDAAELERVEERLFAIRALARKHQVAPDDLPELSERLRLKLEALDDGENDLAELAQVEVAARASYADAAATLAGMRHAAAQRLDRAVMSELSPLKMERAVFATDVQSAPPGPDGTESVQFKVATNPGAPAGPLGKIASGGELSRFLLALKVCLSQTRDSGLTLIFDEIDRGVGGATADAVGRRLAKLASDGQVLVVTHSPQVAALGSSHWRVEKSVSGDTTLSTVVPLAADDREGEIARMLAGDTVTAEARAAARALLTG